MVVSFRSQKGISLIEIVVVAAIIGLLALVVAVPFSSFRSTRALQNTANTIVSTLNDARAKTLASLQGTSYGVYVDTNQLVLFTGTNYDAGNATNQTIAFETPVTLATISLNGGGSSIRFDRLKGTTSDYGTITISLPDGKTNTITVSSTGTVMRN